MREKRSRQTILLGFEKPPHPRQGGGFAWIIVHKVICVACHRAQHIFSGTVDGQYSASLLFVLWRRPLTQTAHRPRHPTSSSQHVRDQHEFKRIPFSNPFDSMLCFFFFGFPLVDSPRQRRVPIESVSSNIKSQGRRSRRSCCGVGRCRVSRASGAEYCPSTVS